MSEEQKDGKGYSTDIHEIVSCTFEQKFSLYAKQNQEEHEKTRAIVADAAKTIRQAGDTRIHNIVQDFVLAVLAVFVFWKR